jgi:hypothetical protein
LHTGARYHESWFTFRNGGALNPDYRDWWESNPFSYVPEERPGPKTRTLEAIREELGPWVFLNERMSARLEEAFERNPQQTSLMSSDLRRGLESGRIENPAGALYNELGKIRH